MKGRRFLKQLGVVAFAAPFIGAARARAAAAAQPTASLRVYFIGNSVTDTVRYEAAHGSLRVLARAGDREG